MTPEKFEILREWIRAEIARGIDIDIIDSYDCDWAQKSNTKADEMYVRVVRTFCGGPS